ncbi:peptidase M28 [halophilic archaeon DL31]|jgi:Predicted aminopeptidases|nr:peptidase M28 [halophilic archaeon DL31]
MLENVDRTLEERLIAAIDPDRLRTHIDAFEGTVRESGTDDEWTASEYIVETLESDGVDATLHEYEGLISIPESASVTVTTPTRHEISEAITTSFSASTAPGGEHAELVHLPEITEEATAAADVAGKFVYTTGLPTPEPVCLLEDAGAAGAVFGSINEDELHEMIVTPVWGTPSTETATEIPDLPVVEVSHDEGAWLAEHLADGPVELNVTTEVTTELMTLPCPVGEVSGDSDRFFLVGNHVDSWHEGITDNATAMAATLELARVLAEHEDELARGVRFGFWSAHSTGRYAGSAWYADEHWNDLRENGVGYLHLDLNGLRGAEELWYQHTPELGDEHLDALTVPDLRLPADAQEELGLEEPDSGNDTEAAGDNFLGDDHLPGRNSDQSFWGAGMPSLLSGARLQAGTKEGGPVGGGWWWHTPEDTADKVDYDVLTEETKLYLALCGRIAGSAVMPHDYAASVADIVDALDEIEAAAGGAVEFDDLRGEAESLQATLEAVNTAIEEAESAESQQAAEDLQVALGNALVPAEFKLESDYEHDPALPQGRLPSLQGAAELAEATGRRRRFLETDLQRGRSKLTHQLRRAERAAEAFLDEHGE